VLGHHLADLALRDDRCRVGRRGLRLDGDAAAHGDVGLGRALERQRARALLRLATRTLPSQAPELSNTESSNGGAGGFFSVKAPAASVSVISALESSDTRAPAIGFPSASTSVKVVGSATEAAAASKSVAASAGILDLMGLPLGTADFSRFPPGS
jgi:hypothetical protein